MQGWLVRREAGTVCQLPCVTEADPRTPDNGGQACAVAIIRLAGKSPQIDGDSTGSRAGGAVIMGAR